MQLMASEEYGLRCLLQLAERADAGSARGQDPAEPDRARPVSIQSVAEAEGLSAEYAAKLLRTLRLGGLVTSTRGAGGGYRLARPAGQISVWDAVEVLGGELFPEHFCRCHPGQRADCVRSTRCTLRPLWSSLARQVRSQLERVSLADLCRGTGNASPGLDVISAPPKMEDLPWRA